LYCPKNQVYSLENQKCQDCPSATPIFNGESCVACPANQFYNSQYKACQNCPGGQSLNINTGKCLCPNGQFYNGAQCIECFHPKYFDINQ